MSERYISDYLIGSESDTSRVLGSPTALAPARSSTVSPTAYYSSIKGGSVSALKSSTPTRVMPIGNSRTAMSLYLVPSWGVDGRLLLAKL